MRTHTPFLFTFLAAAGAGVCSAGAARAEEGDFWSFRAVARPEVPAVAKRGWVTNPIDAFILARLEAAGLEPAPPAERGALLRRAYYDLTGLPPSPEEVDAFLADESAGAFATVVDRLLDSPRYGERWGRHWLDLVRFAETNSFERDTVKPNAWRYRDWVIESLNGDKPYDRFILEQLAGDELDEPTAETIIATGFYRLGPWDDEPTDPLQARYDELDDVVTTTGQVFLGLTINCARCHAHKLDPLPQEDYYRLLAFFKGVLPTKRGDKNSILTAIELPMDDGGEPQTIEALSVKEGGAVPPPTHVLVRGNAHAEGDRVEPGFPEVLGFPAPRLPERPEGASSSGRRRALAEWITSPRNPLTARVMANRLWQYHFGRGIVRSPNNFGANGDRPTHPELLDWLASELVARGWRLKPMHRLIMLSSAYRMSSRGRPGAVEKDPENDLFWRFDMRRLQAEEVRDTILSVNGTLNLAMGGPGVYPLIPKAVLAGQSKPGDGWGESTETERARRSVYIHAKRSLLTPILATFDAADTDASCPVRFATTQPTQALSMLNGEFMNREARKFAERLRRDAGADPAAQARRALRLALQRRPSAAEIEECLRLIEALRRDEGLSEDAALEQFALAVLNLNEFLYLD